MAGLTAWKEAPARFLRWNVMVSRENPNEATVTVLIGAARSVGEWCAKSVLVCEVDRTAARITRVSTAEQYPRKTALRPLKDGIALRGVIADLVLTIGLDLQPVTDWQRLAANAGSRN
ncbi:MAG TPA: hypothetical protein VL614_15075 [Acetobacteraceae bacterium]|nr:hypothetical protein [Acetobacteraceae bacterium]